MSGILTELSVRIQAAAAGGTFALISNTSAGSGDALSVTTSAIDTTGANLLVVAVASYNGATASTLSDSKGNTWNARTAYSDAGTGGIVRIQLFYASSPTVGTGHTFTGSSPGSGSYPCIAVAAFSGANTTPYASESGDTDGSSGSTDQPGTVTPGSNNNLIITGVAHNNAGSTMSVNESFTISNQTTAVGSQCVGVAMGYQIQTTATARNPTWTLSAGTGLVCSAAVFIPS